MNPLTEAANTSTSILLRTLFISQQLPYPPMGGSSLRIWQNINLMKQFGPVGIFCLPTVPQTLDQKPPIDLAVWCMQPDSSRETAIGKLVPRLRQMGWLLTHVPPYTDKYFTPEASNKLEEILDEFQPDVVIFEEIWLYSYLQQVKQRDCTVILDAHNVEASLFQQIYAAKQSQSLPSKVDTGVRLALIESIERNFVRQVDQVWVCSEQDANLFAETTPKSAPMHVIPNGVDVRYYSDVRIQGAEFVRSHALADQLGPNPHTLIFTASFSYMPNAVAAQFLIEKIYPQLQQAYPECRLLLVGTNPTEFMQKAAHRDPNIIVTGKVPDIRPYLAAASVVIVPLLQGGGTRLKILEAFAAGRSVVSTTKGAEGLNVQHGAQLLIGNSVEELVARVCQVWENPALNQKLVQTAWEFVQQNYAWGAIAQKVEQAMQELLLSPQATAASARQRSVR
jgi:polysaccharide biosynthesis protein PslH